MNQANTVSGAGSQYTLRQGKRYRATIALFGFEQFASDDMIRDKLTEAGFTEVEVTGGGGTRTAEGRWGKPDVTGQIDHHIVSVTEIA
jgi:hypothetical protein